MGFQTTNITAVDEYFGLMKYKSWQLLFKKSTLISLIIMSQENNEHLFLVSWRKVEVSDSEG